MSFNASCQALRCCCVPVHTVTETVFVVSSTTGEHYLVNPTATIVRLSEHREILDHRIIAIFRASGAVTQITANEYL